MQIYLVLALLFGIVIAVFAVQNSTVVPISILWLTVDGVAVSVLVLASATLGALAMFLFGLGREIRHRVRSRSTRRAAQSSEQRIAELEATVARLEEEKAEAQTQLEDYRRALAGDRDADQTPDQVGDRGRGGADQEHPRAAQQHPSTRQQ
jgi:uncharacterized integral membrane protein